MSKFNKLFYRIENGKMKKLFEIEDVLFGVWNMLVFLDDIFHHRKDKLLLERNNELKKDDLDECYIILNGPSLKNIDLTKLKDKDTFTVNFFYKQKIWSNFVSKYFLILEPDIFTRCNVSENKGFEDIESYLKNIYRLNDTIKLIMHYRHYYDARRIFGNLDRVYFIKSKYMIRFDIEKIRLDMHRNMTSFFGVTGTAIAMAMSMGYKKVYLLGFDGDKHTYKSAIRHFYDDDTKISSEYEYNISNDEERMLFSLRVNAIQSPIFYILKMYAKKNNIEIINLTEGSAVKTFPFANFDDIINKD